MIRLGLTGPGVPRVVELVAQGGLVHFEEWPDETEFRLVAREYPGGRVTLAIETEDEEPRTTA